MFHHTAQDFPEASPHRAVVRVKVRSLSLSITHEKMKSVIAFNM
jgi:hypothetical protein